MATDLPRDTFHEQYRALSRTVDGVADTVDLLRDARGRVETQCACLAAEAGRCCWHRGAARLGHQHAIPVVVACGCRLRAKPQPITAATLSGTA